MPCYSPLSAIRVGDEVRIVGNVHDGRGGVPNFRVPCGRCVGCRLKYRQMWAIRCVHEASMYDANCVVTLTYRPEDLPNNGSLFYRDFQLFMKRLRQYRRRFFLKNYFRRKFFTQLSPVEARKLVELSKVRFFCGGEYGEDNARPHYHAVLFNFDFPDKVRVPRSQRQAALYSSALADKLWQKGSVRVGVMDFDSANYVAGYVSKKVYGDLAEDHYRVGTEDEVVPEFAHMSRRPGIGRSWIEKYFPETLRDLSVVSRSRRVHMPRSYIKYVEKIADTTNAREELNKRMRQLDSRPRTLLAAQRIASARLGLSRRKL